MVYLQIRNLAKQFPKEKGGQLRVLDSINLDVRKGEFVTIFGPNGCGKTTLLRIISGFETYNNGIILIRNSAVEKTKSYLVLQNPDDSVFNWMNTTQNIAIALPKQDKEKKFVELLEKIQVGGKTLLQFGSYYPYQLSGGLKQLAVIARAITFNPDLLLLDEPFSSLDFKTAMQMEDNLLQVWHKTRKTVLFVSHNVDEAVYLTDKIVILSNQPTKVKRVISVGLPRPRKQEMKLSAAFQKIKREVLNCFSEAQ